MNTQRNDLGNIVRTILLIAIGIVIGVGIGIGIGRIGSAPSPISQKVGRVDRQAGFLELGSHEFSKFLVRHDALEKRLNAAVLDSVAAEVLRVDYNNVHQKNLLV